MEIGLRNCKSTTYFRKCENDFQVGLSANKYISGPALTVLAGKEIKNRYTAFPDILNLADENNYVVLSIDNYRTIDVVEVTIP